MANHKYYMTYNMQRHPEGISAEQVAVMARANDNFGAADAILFVSYIDGGEAGLSLEIGCCDGRTSGVVSEADVYRGWMILGRALARSEQLSPEKRARIKEALMIAGPVPE